MHDVDQAPRPFRLTSSPDQPTALAVGGLDDAVALPLVECLTLEHGRCFVDHRLTQTAVGAGLREVRREPLGSPWPGTRVVEHDPTSGLSATVDLWHPTDATVRARTTVRNDGDRPVHLTAVSLACASLLPGADLDGLDLLVAPSSWMAEQRWSHHRLSEALVGVGTELHGESPRDRLTLSSESGWSSGRWEPVGFVTDPTSGRAAGWQVEHNGGWTVELARRSSTLGLCVFGPTDLHHHWMHRLDPGEEFTSPTVALAFSADGWQGAAAELTTYRRALRAGEGPTGPAPIVFNDYMNTLMADPTTEKLSTLVPAAARAGAEVYCIDAGWHADDESWWDGVGRWEPSTRRFPGGLTEVLDLIAACGMTSGLWIEPLAVGLDSPLVDELPPEAFMRRAGVAIVEQNRLRLDMRHPAARSHLDAVIDRMVGYGIGYLKIDDNFSVGSGPDEGADSPGDGLLEHSRAWAAWLADLPRRHPGLRVENCASGGMTTDYALLSSATLQSTSDLQDPLRYPPIAANATLTVLPEQAASWAYPQPDMDDEEIVLTMTTSLAGALYLSGHLDRMDDHQLDLVRAGVDLAKELRTDLVTDLPWWPDDVAAWTDEWVVTARQHPTSRDGILVVWHRPVDGSTALGPRGGSALELPQLSGTRLEQIYPPTPLVADPGILVDDSGAAPRLSCTSPRPTGRVYRVRDLHNGVTDAAGMEKK